VTLSGGAILLSNRDPMSILCTGNDSQIYLNSIPPLPDIPLELQAWLKVEPVLLTVGRELELLRGIAAERAAIV
jgi:hypothetical protein